MEKQEATAVTKFLLARVEKQEKEIDDLKKELKSEVKKNRKLHKKTLEYTMIFASVVKSATILFGKDEDNIKKQSPEVLANFIALSLETIGEIEMYDSSSSEEEETIIKSSQ